MALVTVRDRLALALDVDTADQARSLAGSLQEWFGVVKVGLELFTRCGPSIVRELQSDGFDIFLDLKLHDIPNTVQKAAVSLAHRVKSSTCQCSWRTRAAMRAASVSTTEPFFRRAVSATAIVFSSPRRTPSACTHVAQGG